MSKLLLWATEKLEPYVSMTSDQIYPLLELPPRPELGDAAFPCYTLSRTQRKPPAAIGRTLKSALRLYIVGT